MVNHFCSEIISWCQQHNTWSESWVTAAAPPQIVTQHTDCTHSNTTLKQGPNSCA
jgi:hypothetical protein